MDERSIKLEARLLVIEYVLAHIMKRQYRILELSDEAVRQSHDEMIKSIGAQPIFGIDPAMSDHVTGEIEDAARRFVEGLEETMGWDDRKLP